MKRGLAPVRHVPAPVGALTNLFDRLHAQQIRYCHWKSTEHLRASLDAALDLDVLVHRADARRLTRLLTDVDFKRFGDGGHGYPGVEDYLGFDPDTGRLSHLHLHYQLTLGEQFLKGYRLPWEDLVLDTRTMDAEHGVYVIDPNLEALLLVTRAALKLRARDYLLAAAGYRYIRGGALRELRWLARRVNRDRLAALARPLVGDEAAALLSEIVADVAPSIRQLRAFRRIVRPSLGGYRMYGAIAARRRRWARELGWVWVAVRNRLRGMSKRSTRTAPQGGVAVTVTGPQVRATAVAQELIAWLSPELAVVPNLGPRRSEEARRARARGWIVVADRLHAGPVGDRPDLIIHLGQPSNGGGRVERPGETPTVGLDVRAAPAILFLQAKQALWECL